MSCLDFEPDSEGQPDPCDSIDAATIMIHVDEDSCGCDLTFVED